MTALPDFRGAFARCPLVAILRGITPAQVDAIGDVLVEAGFTLIEVPLNSPQPLASIERLARRLEGVAMVGAGTVLTAGQVTDVANAGGRMIVSPNTDIRVIRQSVSAGLVSLPGCMTPSEAFQAIDAGAHGLKFFPAEAISPRAIKAMAAVLPMEVPRLAVGGITPETIAEWRSAGVTGFGLGSALYSAGASPAAVRASAAAFIKAALTGPDE